MKIHPEKWQLSYHCDHNHFSCSAIDLATKSLVAFCSREWRGKGVVKAGCRGRKMVAYVGRGGGSVMSLEPPQSSNEEAVKMRRHCVVVSGSSSLK